MMCKIISFLRVILFWLSLICIFVFISAAGCEYKAKGFSYDFLECIMWVGLALMYTSIFSKEVKY